MKRESLYEMYSARQEFEHDLINRRVTWLLTFQGILFVAYGLGRSNAHDLPPTFSTVIASCGVASGLAAFVGIFAAAWAKRQNWQDYVSLAKLADVDDDQCRTARQEKLDEFRREWGVRTRITKWGLAPDFFFPFLFISAWVTLLIRF
jgi:hypothetical protein